MTVPGRDSAWAPSADQVAVARSAGVKVWGGYLGSGPNVGLLHLWSQADFDRVRVLGGTPIAFCSGWDDPGWVKDTAAAWRVLPCLDVEAGIRGPGPWVQPWLDASGAGLYGGYEVHVGLLAAFHVLAFYPLNGNPTQASWLPYDPRPSTPCIWQWQGTHDEYGTSCDSWWADDAFGGDYMATVDDIYNALVGPGGWQSPESVGTFVADLHALLMAGQVPGSDPNNGVVNWTAIQLRQLVQGQQALSTAIAQLGTPTVNVAALAAALAPQVKLLDLSQLEADLVRQLPQPIAGQLLAALKAALP